MKTTPVFTSACNKPDAGQDSYSEQLITRFFQTVLAIPSLVDHGQDFDFIGELISRFSNTNHLELFYPLPGMALYPVLSYQNHWVEILDDDADEL